MSDPNGNQSKRGGFSSLGFILASAGSAVGLGNIWRFPYMAGSNGGGAFVLIYIIAMAVIGIPLLLVEFSIGRHGKVNAIDSYAKINPKLKFIGYIGFCSAPMFLSYYSVLSGWTIFYTIRSVTGLTSIPTDELGGYFFNFVAQPGLPLLFHLIFMAITVYIIARGVSGGIEKYSKILMPILFILMIILVIRSVTLPGASEGLSWFLRPDFSKITPVVIVAAIGQIFFSLSVGMSGMVTYASYLSGKEKLISTAGIVSFFDIVVALMAGLMIFPACFTYGLEPNAGPALIFITLPAVFSSMPMGAIFAMMFFFLLVVANLTSAISILEMPTAYLIEKRGMTRPRAATFIGLIAFILGIAVSFGYGIWSHLTIADMNILDIFDYIGSNIVLPVCGFAASIAVGWIWKNGAVEEVTNGGTVHVAVGKAWLQIVRFIVPILLILVFLSQFGVIG